MFDSILLLGGLQKHRSLRACIVALVINECNEVQIIRTKSLMQKQMGEEEVHQNCDRNQKFNAERSE